MLACARIVLAVAAVLVLSGCGVRYAYSQLDWLVPWYLRDYVALNGEQRALLDRRLAQRLDWHCRSQLPAYAAMLREAHETAAAPSVRIAALERHAGEVEVLLRELAAAVAADVAELLATLSDEQVAALFANLEARNREARGEYLDGDEAASRTRQAERMEKRLRRWFGGLDGAQRELVAAWADRTVPVAEQWLAHRLGWQRRLAESLPGRRAWPAFADDVRTLLVEPDAHWSAWYRSAVTHNRHLTLRLLADVHDAATPRQRDRLLRELDSLARQLERITCTDRAPAARAAGRAGDP